MVTQYLKYEIHFLVFYRVGFPSPACALGGIYVCLHVHQNDAFSNWCRDSARHMVVARWFETLARDMAIAIVFGVGAFSMAFHDVYKCIGCL